MGAVHVTSPGESAHVHHWTDSPPRPLVLRHPLVFGQIRALRRVWGNVFGYSAAGVSLVVGWGWRSVQRGDMR